MHSAPMHLRHACAALILCTLAACGSSPNGDSEDSLFGEPTKAVTADRAGTFHDERIVSPITGDTTVVTVYEPTQLKRGESYPLVLQGPGYGGVRHREPDAFITRLRDAGFYVISIDPRGFGESSGKVRVMSPDFEGQNLVSVIDWAENLEGLRRYKADGRMVVGSYGYSYGGMFQFALAGTDPKQRLRIIAPDITPHALDYALYPNGVIKSGFALALIGLGEAEGVTSLDTLLPSLFNGTFDLTRLPLNEDPVIVSELAGGLINSRFSDSAVNLLKYHSAAYFCDGVAAGPQSFLIGQPDPRNVAPRAYPKIDALITQGFRDALFNFNDGLGNYECLKALGGDVRFLTHQTGHILPVSLATIPLGEGATLEDALDPLYAALTLPAFQDIGGSETCGTQNLEDIRFAWLQEKLQAQSGALDATLKSGKDVCLSLGEGDAVSVPSVKRGGASFAINDSTPQLNSVLGVAGAVLGNGAREALLATQPLYTAPAGGKVLAGLPKLDVTFARLPDGATSVSCAIPILPLACDPTLFIGIGHRKAGATRWDLIDDQLTPVRGFGAHSLEMTGIAERLAAGDELALLIYGFHAQYPVTFSRDLLVPALRVTGSVQLPLLESSDMTHNGV